MRKSYFAKLRMVFIPLSISLFTITNSFNANAQKVGVGTATPTVELDLESANSSAVAGDGTQLCIEANHGTNGDSEMQFKIRGTTKFTWGIDDDQADVLSFFSPATPSIMSIDGAGAKFGFGVLTPRRNA